MRRRFSQRPPFAVLPAKDCCERIISTATQAAAGSTNWVSRDAAEAWYRPEWRRKAKETFGAEPIVTYYETYVTVDNERNETIVRQQD